jgi:hypothetical protein
MRGTAFSRSSIVGQNIELATVSQRGAASKGGFCNGSAGLRLLRVKTEGRQYTRIGSALSQLSDIRDAGRHFAFVPGGDANQ